MKNKISLLVFSLLIGTVAASLLHAEGESGTEYIVTTFEDLGPDASSCPAVEGSPCSLRQAITENNNHHNVQNVITLSAGTYSLTRGIERNTITDFNEITGETYTDDFNLAVANYDDNNNSRGDLDVMGNGVADFPLIIKGVGASATIIDAALMADLGTNDYITRSRPFHFLSGYTRVQDVTIKGGSVTRYLEPSITYDRGFASVGDGGGILINPPAALTLNRVIITENAIFNGCGGGIANYGVLTANKLTVSYNEITNEVAEATYESVSHASVGYINSGGGLCNALVPSNTPASATLRDVTFFSNRGRRYGGGVYNAGGASLSITNGTFYLNAVTRGISRESPLLGSDTDTSLGWGGAIFNAGGTSTVRLTNTTIASNVAQVNGAGISDNNGGFDDLVPGSDIRLANTVLSGNQLADATPSNCSFFSTTNISQGYNFSNDTTCIGAFNLTIDQNAVIRPMSISTCDYPVATIGLPDFKATVAQLLVNQILYPGFNNPAKGAVPSSSGRCTLPDQKGTSRAAGLSCDSGAYQTSSTEILRNDSCPAGDAVAPPPGFDGGAGTSGVSGTGGGSGSGSGGTGGTGGGTGSCSLIIENQ